MEKEVVLVTGGSRGIGKAIVERLINKNRKVYFTFNNSSDLAIKFEKEIIKKGFFAKGIKLDISNSDDVKEKVSQIINLEKKIDVLVNNAGITNDANSLLMSDEKWDSVIQTNLSGTFYLSRTVGRYMISKKSGKIINISSIVSYKSGKGQANYIASKSGIEGLTKSFAVELAPKGVLVNSVVPGIIETDMTINIIKKHKDKILDKILLGRFGKPEEVANLVNFLSSEESSYITGQSFIIDGGLLFNV